MSLFLLFFCFCFFLVCFFFLFVLKLIVIESGLILILSIRVPCSTRTISSISWAMVSFFLPHLDSVLQGRLSCLHFVPFPIAVVVLSVGGILSLPFPKRHGW